MSTKRIGSTMYVVAIIGLIALLALLFSEQLEHQRNPNQSVKSRTAPDGAAAIILNRNRFGHYVATGALNGVTAEFMLDTGATDVAVSAAIAEAAGLRRGPAYSVMTANGETLAYATTIDSIRIGDIVEREVRATIVPNLGGMGVLLGMSFLERLDFSQRGDTLVLKSRRPQGGEFAF